MAAQGTDFGVLTYKVFIDAVLIMAEVYSEYAAKKFGKLKLPKLKLPSPPSLKLMLKSTSCRGLVRLAARLLLTQRRSPLI